MASIRHKGKWHSTMLPKAKEARERGWSWRQIARYLNVGEEAVRRRLDPVWADRRRAQINANRKPDKRKREERRKTPAVAAPSITTVTVPNRGAHGSTGRPTRSISVAAVETPAEPAPPVLALPVAPAIDIELTGAARAVMDLGRRQCKFPIGDPSEPDFRFCGQPRKSGSPYCPECSQRAYGVQRGTESAEHKMARMAAVRRGKTRAARIRALEGGA